MCGTWSSNDLENKDSYASLSLLSSVLFSKVVSSMKIGKWPCTECHK